MRKFLFVLMIVAMGMGFVSNGFTANHEDSEMASQVGAKHAVYEVPEHAWNCSPELRMVSKEADRSLASGEGSSGDRYSEKGIEAL